MKQSLWRRSMKQAAPHRFAGRTAALAGLSHRSGSNGVSHAKRYIKSHADRRVLGRVKSSKNVDLWEIIR